MDKDEQDHEEGGRTQGVISLGRRRTTLGRVPNVKNYHILLLEEDNWKRSKSSPMINSLMYP